jgi:hypothetical protein
VVLSGGGYFLPFHQGTLQTDYTYGRFLYFPRFPKANLGGIAMTDLRQRMIDSLQLRGFSERTQEAYVRAVRQPGEHFHKSPDTCIGRNHLSGSLVRIPPKNCSSVSFALHERHNSGTRQRVISSAAANAGPIRESFIASSVR